MANKPILFNTEMVKAIMDGRKTQTRRIIKTRHGGELEIHDDPGGVSRLCEKCGTVCRGLVPPCAPGDILWVRETWCDPNPENPFAPLAYKADFPMHWETDQTEHGDPVTITAEEMKWKPSIHMPKEAARIFLRVKDVRVERLKDIHEKYKPGPGNPVIQEGFRYLCDFIATWENTIKPTDRDDYGWYANPWVWVIEFERCEKPEGWSV